MRTLFITKGLPACGKSTWAKSLLKKEPYRFKRLNKDELRLLLDDGVYSPDNEVFIREVQDKMIIAAFDAGYDVILDNTHLVPQTLKKLHKLAEAYGDVKVLEKCFNESVKTCLERNALRTGSARVPDKVINDMARGAGIDRGKQLVDRETYYPPRDNGTTVYEQDESLPKAIMCDLDGTLALMGDRSPYDASECDTKDKPNWPVIKTVLAMYAQGYEIIFMSGRDSKYREQTIRFIEKYCIDPLATAFVNVGAIVALKPISYQLHMRSQGDMRKDSIVKQELFDAHVRDKFNVLFVLDDRNQVVDFWRSVGIPTFQVAPGAF